MTETVSRQAVMALPKVERCLIFLLEEKGQVKIVDDDSGEEKE